MMCKGGDREVRRNHMAHIRSPAISEEEEAVTYLLDIPESIFKLHTNSTDMIVRFQGTSPSVQESGYSDLPQG